MQISYGKYKFKINQKNWIQNSSIGIFIIMMLIISDNSGQKISEHYLYFSGYLLFDRNFHECWLDRRDSSVCHCWNSIRQCHDDLYIGSNYGHSGKADTPSDWSRRDVGIQYTACHFNDIQCEALYVRLPVCMSLPPLWLVYR